MKLAAEKKEGLNIRKNPEGLVFKVLVQPRSSKNMIAGLHNEALKIKLTAPPVDNAANQMCLKFLAKCLDVSKSSLEIIAGHSSRHKQILLRSDQIKLTPSEFKHLKQLIENLAAHPNPDKPELKIEDLWLQLKCLSGLTESP